MWTKQQHHVGEADPVFTLNFNYFVEMLVKICSAVSVILKKPGIKLHDAMIYICVRQLSF
jgi:hypothetical protein